MESIVIPDGVTTIGGSAFSDCTNLTSISIPKSVTSIGILALARTTSLSTIIVENGNAKYDSRDNCNAIIETATNALAFGCKNTVIPNTVTTISSGAFQGCTTLTSIVIPESVTAIDDYAFTGTTGLIAVTVKWAEPITISSTFSNRKNATLYVPIGSKAAYEAANYWKEFKEIKEGANPGTGTANDPFTCAGVNTFVTGLNADTPTETEYYVKGKVCGMDDNFGYKYGNGTFWISDDGSTEDKFFVYRTLYYNKEKYNGGSVPNIGDEVVLCGKMVNYLGTTPETYINECRLVSINGKTVGQPLEQNDLFVIKTAENIDMFFVAGCVSYAATHTDDIGCSVGYAVGTRPETYSGTPTAISASYTGVVTVPGTAEGLEVRTIAPSAFAGAKLSGITIPASVFDIETNAFKDCENLASVTMPENVVLNNGTFMNCTSLTSVELPKGVQLWATDVIFSGCTNLTSITVNDATPYNLQGAYLVDDPSKVTLYVPAGSKTAYEAAGYWKDFKEIVEKEPEIPVTEIWAGSQEIKDWNGLTIDRENLTSLNIGDVLHVEVTDVAESEAYAALFDGTWTQIAPWYGLSPDKTEAVFNLTGDMVRELKTYGMVLTCNGYTIKRIYTTPAYTGSENSIWLGNQTNGDISVDNSHFIIANRKTGVKAGDIIRLAYTGSGTPNIWYFGEDSEWTWKTFNDAVLTTTETGADVTVTGAMATLLNKNNLIVQLGDAGLTLTQVELISGAQTVLYQVAEGDAFASGTQKELENITLTYGEAGGEDFQTPIGWVPCEAEGIEFPYYSPGNGVNGNKAGGTFYVFNPKKNGLLTVVVRQNSAKPFYVEENGSVMNDFNGVTKGEDGTYQGTYKIEVKANRIYKMYCSGSKLGFFGFIYDWRDNADLINIEFADANVKALCVANWDTNKDGELSEAEAAAVTNEQFADVSFESVTADSWTFDELQYFTGLTVLNTKLAETKISSVKIPGTVTEIGENAFRKTQLTSIILPDAVKKVGESAFAECGELATANLGRVEEIGVNAFIATSIVNLTVPETVKSVGIEPFSWNWTMKQATLKEGVTKVFDTMFHGNVNLTTVSLPSTLTTIEDRAFQQCEALTTISIPEGVTAIGEQAFNKCTSLVEVTVANPTPVAISEEVFSNRKNATLYVPEGCVAAYKAADYWKEFKKILVVGTTDPVNETDIAQMPNAIYMEPVTGRAGRKFWVDLKLKSESAISAYTFDLQLPVGVTIATDEDGNYIYESGERHEYVKPVLNYNEGSSTYYMRVLNIKNATASDGVAWRLYLKVADGLTLGDYPVIFTNVTYTPADLTETQNIPETTCRLTVEEHGTLKGDANDDDIVNIADVTCIVNHSAHLDTPVFVETAADVTGNGEADLTDAMRIIYYIVGRIDSPTDIPASAPAFNAPAMTPAFNAPAMAPAFNAPTMAPAFNAPDVSSLTNAIYADNLSVKPGKTIPLTLFLKNEKTAKDYQFQLVLPEGVTIPKDDNDKYACVLSSRHQGHEVEINFKDGVYKVAVYSFSTEALTGNDGEICTFQLQVADEMAEGNYTATVKEAAYSLVSGMSVSLPKTEIKLSVNGGNVGDVNGDSFVNIEDAKAIVNYLVGNPDATFNETAADVNGDDKIDIADAVQIVNLVVGKISELAPKFDFTLPETE